jgi:hypothetical protein
MTARPSAITVNGSTLGPVPGTLGLVGGPVSITGGTLSAPAGTIHGTSVAGTGEVPVDPRNTPASTATGFGPVDIKGGTKLDVSDPSGLGSGGSVFIRSGTLTINASEINADNYRAGLGGEIALQADGQIALGNGANVHAGGVGDGRGGSVIVTAGVNNIGLDNSTINADIRGAGNAGDVNVRAGTLAVLNDGVIASRTFGSGSGGTVSVTISGQLSIVGKPDCSLTGIASDAGQAGSLSIANTSAISSNNGAISSNNGATASNPSGHRSAGVITITAGSLTITRNGAITSDTSGFGNAGSVSVSVDSQLAIDASWITANSLAGSGGNAGNVTVKAGALSIVNGGVISSDALGSVGNPGQVTVTAGDLSVANSGIISAGSITVINGGSIGQFGRGQAVVPIPIESSTSGSNSPALTEISPMSALATLPTQTSIQSRKYCRHLPDRANCAAVLNYCGRPALRAPTGRSRASSRPAGAVCRRIRKRPCRRSTLPAATSAITLRWAQSPSRRMAPPCRRRCI